MRAAFAGDCSVFEILPVYGRESFNNFSTRADYSGSEKCEEAVSVFFFGGNFVKISEISSSELFGQRYEDAFGATDVTKPVDVLVVYHLANKLGTASA